MRIRPAGRTSRRPRARQRRRFLILESVESRLLLASFTVTSAADNGPGSLRQAILSLNASKDPANSISFAIDSGEQTISLRSPLPPITVPLQLDGTTQPGYSEAPLIQIEGHSDNIQGNGLTLAAGSGGSTIRGLEVLGFASGAGIDVESGSNRIEGNVLGDIRSLTYPARDANRSGILIASSNNTIGGLAAATRNVISGNAKSCIDIEGSANTVEGNYIGTDATGLRSIQANGAAERFVGLGDGVLVGANALQNTIGGSIGDARNLISGGSKNGIEIIGDQNYVEGNYIGTDPTGEMVSDSAGNDLGNLDGVLIEGTDNVVGVPPGFSSGASQRNVISGNLKAGIEIAGPGNSVRGNYLGTDAEGTSPPNSPQRGSGFPGIGNVVGVLVTDGGMQNTIGGTTPAAVNVISSNFEAGILISGTSAGNPTFANLVEGNYIGTDDSGQIVPMSRESPGTRNGTGVVIEGFALKNTIGGTVQGARNLIENSSIYGVDLTGLMQGAPLDTQIIGNIIASYEFGGVHLGNLTLDNLIAGNTIGVDANGNLSNPNGFLVFAGVLIDSDARYNTIGGSTRSASNVIGGNLEAGVEIDGRFTELNSVEGNFIGTDPSGHAISNGIGVILNDSRGNTIGGTIGGAGSRANVIGDNVVGIEIAVNDPVLGNANSIEGNLIGVTKAAGGQPVPNLYGIWLNDVGSVTIGGTAQGQGNLIADNTNAGVHISGIEATGNQIEGNSILGPNSPPSNNRRGTRTDPTNPFPIGVYIENASSNTIGGTGAGQGNTISGNNVGVYIVGTGGSSTNNQILGNLIGASASGGPNPGNVLYGVIFVNAPFNSAPESGPGANRIIGSGIANFREYSGPVPTTNSKSGGHSSSAARKPAHHASHVLHRSPRHKVLHTRIALHGHVVPTGPLRKHP
jgi:hypothetical protein